MFIFKNRDKSQKWKSDLIIEDQYVLDNENRIIVTKNPDTTKHKELYLMIHQRVENHDLIDVNKWYVACYHFGDIHDITVIKDFGLFKVQKGDGLFNAIYDYKKGTFIIPIGDWNIVDSGYENSILKKYEGFLGMFTISSDVEEDDVCSYTNKVTGKTMEELFYINDGNYYGIINLDGSIRGNKLFKGTTFSKITQIIDLEQYKSLDEFKKERKNLCNAQKQRRKEEYQKMIKERNDGTMSPYLDNEVFKVLNLKKF